MAHLLLAASPPAGGKPLIHAASYSNVNSQPSQVGNVDLTSTWLDLAGVDDPHAHERDGISMKVC